MSEGTEGTMEEPSEETDPVKIVLSFTRHLEALRGIKTAKKVCPACKHSFDPLAIRDRDEYLITLLLSILADPHHHIGKLITRDLFKVWIERGGIVPKQGCLTRALREQDTFDFAAQYLYDYGMPVKEIAIALGAGEVTVRKAIRFYRKEDTDDLQSVDVPSQE